MAREPQTPARDVPAPAHVATLGPDRLAFGGPAKTVHDVLAARGLDSHLFRDEGLNLCLRWDVTDGRLFDDGDLHELLGALSAAGVVFLERYGAADGPAELMRLLRAEGRVPPFTSLVLRGPGDWELTAHD